MARRASLAGIEDTTKQLREQWKQLEAVHEEDAEQEQEQEADAKDAADIAAEMRKKLAAKKKAKDAARQRPQPEPEPEPELRPGMLWQPGTPSAEAELWASGVLQAHEAAAHEAADAEWRSQALAPVEELVAAAAPPVAADAQPSPRSSPRRTREESRRALSEAKQSLDELMDDSHWVTTKLDDSTVMPVLVAQSPYRRGGPRAVVEKEDWRLLVAETGCREVARKAASAEAEREAAGGATWGSVSPRLVTDTDALLDGTAGGGDATLILRQLLGLQPEPEPEPVDLDLMRVSVEAVARWQTLVRAALRHARATQPRPESSSEEEGRVEEAEPPVSSRPPALTVLQQQMQQQLAADSSTRRSPRRNMSTSATKMTAHDPHEKSRRTSRVRSRGRPLTEAERLALSREPPPRGWFFDYMCRSAG